MTTPYPPTPENRWRKTEAHESIALHFDPATPLVTVNGTSIYAEQNGHGFLFRWQTPNGVWQTDERLQGAIASISHVVPRYDWTTIHDLLAIRLLVECDVNRIQAYRSLEASRRPFDHTYRDYDYIDVATPSGQWSVNSNYTMVIPYDPQVEKDLAPLVAAYNKTVNDSRPTPGYVHRPELYDPAAWKPLYAYLRKLKKQALAIGHSSDEFSPTINRRK